LKPVALHAVHVCYAATRLPIVGMGGVASAQDVVDMVACGACDVALGTALFADPDAPRRIRDELSTVDLQAVFGSAHVATSPRVVAV
jgi:dihydroorotate dehydrogenase (NAD+) catalytic subunit